MFPFLLRAIPVSLSLSPSYLPLAWLSIYLSLSLFFNLCILFSLFLSHTDACTRSPSHPRSVRWGSDSSVRGGVKWGIERKDRIREKYRERVCRSNNNIHLYFPVSRPLWGHSESNQNSPGFHSCHMLSCTMRVRHMLQDGIWCNFKPDGLQIHSRTKRANSWLSLRGWMAPSQPVQSYAVLVYLGLSPYLVYLLRTLAAGSRETLKRAKIPALSNWEKRLCWWANDAVKVERFMSGSPASLYEL